MRTGFRDHKFLTIGLAVAFASMAYAQDPAPAAPAKPEQDLTELNLDDLANIQVTTASRKAESLFGVAAALSVVTQEDIKRSGAMNIPEALRLVPGVQVAQISSQQYAVTIRGFNSRFANRLLVLIDGRSIYNSLYGGVYWEDYNVAMQDIERIEVIRGPGGSLWGANAVNGIVNIITKNSKDTQGGMFAQSNGSIQEHNTTALRYGGKMGDGTYRVTALGFSRGQTLLTNGNDAGDMNNGGRLQFRYDGGTDEKGKWLLTADYHRFSQGFGGNLQPSVGGNILTRYNKTYKDGSSDQLQVFFDREDRNVFATTNVRSSTVDFDYQHAMKQMGNHSVVWGLAYRNVNDATQPSGAGRILQEVSQNFQTFSGYVQDEIRLNSKKKLAIGLKVENNEFSGWEYQPNVRFSYEQSDKKTYWASVSRAVRVPNRIQEGIDAFAGNITLPGPTPAQVRVFGNPDFPTSAVIAAETGFRVKLSDKVTLDTALFHNSYTNIDGFAIGAPFVGGTPPGLILPNNLVVRGQAQTFGAEANARIQAASNWRLDAGYSFLQGTLPAGARGLNSPQHQFQVLSTLGLGKKWNFDQAVYFVGAVRDTATTSWTRYDVQLRYAASNSWEFALGGRNLGSSRFNQTGSVDFTAANMIQPEVFARATYRF